MSTFTTRCYQNEYLPLGGSEVNAIVTVTSEAAGGIPAARGRRDRDRRHVGLDGLPGRELEAAREATSVAIDCIRDGVAFGVIAGTDLAAPSIRPKERSSSPRGTRDEAKGALRRLRAEAGPRSDRG